MVAELQRKALAPLLVGANSVKDLDTVSFIDTKAFRSVLLFVLKKLVKQMRSLMVHARAIFSRAMTGEKLPAGVAAPPEVFCEASRAIVERGLQTH